MLLQHLKVVFLICGMLVNHENVRVEFGDNEAQVKLADDLHLFEHVFTVGKTIYRYWKKLHSNIGQLRKLKEENHT